MCRPPVLLALLTSFVLVAPSSGALYTHPSQLPTLTYDYIIVGAGTAGNVIASRLTENPNYSVLVLEAGVSDEGVLPAIVPFFGPTLSPNTPYDWNFTVAPQAALNNRVFAYARGKILGGSSTINYLAHQYGSSADYDKIAAETGDAGWAWNSIKKGIYKHEKFVSSVDGHNTAGQYIPSNHGIDGEVSVSLPGYSQTIDAKVIATTQELADEFPYNPDMGGGDEVLGIGWIQSTIGGGVRSSSSTSYLRKALSRPNLHVLINATVMKLLPTGVRGGKISFGGVQFASSADVPPSFVFANEEIILSAGAIGTPQILLLSGIGPSADLTALGIPTIFDNPSVGNNLTDHVFLPNVFEVRGAESIDHILRDPAAIGDTLTQWTTSKTGVFANGVGNHYGFFRLPPNSSIFSTVVDPASGPKASHWEMIVMNFFITPGVPPPSSGSFMTLASALISATSRGFVKLATANPFDKPIIDPKFVSTEFDKFCLRESVRAVKRFLSGSAWKDYVIGPYGSAAGTTDEEIDAHVQNLASTVNHVMGTAAISAVNAGWGVVNPNLKVKGVEGIRVVDASVFPHPVNAHTQGPIYLLAERAAFIIASQC
ncbi:alcohol oxidase [Phlegmacium glaucopus]|nr:alcohol oxidase [Phlegmacium glaucopus]